MSDSTNPLDQVSQSATQRETTINSLNDALSPSSIYGRRASTSSGLTWGYYGGRWGGFSIANGTQLLADATTTYMVVALASGVVSFSTAITNWNDTTNYARCYLLVTASSVITYSDYRAGSGGTAGGGGSGSGSGAPTDAPYFTDGVSSSLTNERQLVFDTGSFQRTDSGGSPPTGTTVKALKWIQCACSDQSTDLTIGTGKLTFRVPFACTVLAVRASLSTAASGSPTVLTAIDINESGTTILSTKLTIDHGEKTSTTAATPAVISDSALADDAEITIDIDDVGGGARGLVVSIYVV